MGRLSFAGVVLCAVVTRADGIPTVDALAYSGVALNNGVPIVGAPVEVSLWDAVTGGTKLCESTMPVMTGDQGRFKVPLAGCVAAVSQNPDVFVEVKVMGTATQRTRLGAVPFSVQAATASRIVGRARTNGADGGIRTTVEGVFCGVTAPTTGLFQGPNGSTGLGASKSLCESSCGSPTAHMCTVYEAHRSIELGQNLSNSWVKGTTNFAAGGVQLNDCFLWTYGNRVSGSQSVQGTALLNAPTRIEGDWCDATRPIMCCD